MRRSFNTALTLTLLHTEREPSCTESPGNNHARNVAL